MFSDLIYIYIYIYIQYIYIFLWWQSWIFSIITPAFSSVTWSFRNHSNMLIFFLLKKHFLLLSMLRTAVQYFNFYGNLDFSGVFRKVKKKRVFIWNRNLEICNILNFLTATFDQFNASLVNKSINFFQIWMLVHFYKMAKIRFAELNVLNPEHS